MAHSARRPPSAAPRRPHPVPVGVDATEAGPSRLYAPGEPHAVESGKSRLYAPTIPFAAFPSRPAGGVRPITPTHPGVRVDTTEAGPSRLVQYRR